MTEFDCYFPSLLVGTCCWTFNECCHQCNEPGIINEDVQKSAYEILLVYVFV